MRHRILRMSVGALCTLGVLSGRADAQRRYGGFNMGYEPEVHNIPYDGRFIFARLRYTTGPGGYYYRGGLAAWAHGYNEAETNLLRIVREISMLKGHVDATNAIAIDDPQLFRFPVAYMVEAGYWVMNDKEAPALRSYLLKGGFLIMDHTRDGRGNMASVNIAENFRRVFPNLHFQPIDVSHPIFHSFFDIPSFDIVRNYYDFGRPSFLALFQDNDPKKRLLVLLNFNTDVSNYWEFSATGLKPVDESNEAYKLGVNYLIYSVTH